MAYDAVVLDQDGVFLEIDHEGGRHRDDVVEEVLGRFGVTDPPEDHVETLSRLGDPDRMRSVCEGYGISFPEFWRRRERSLLRHQKSLVRTGRKKLYGDFNAVEMLYSDHDLAVVSNNQQEFVDFVLSRFDIGYLFEVSFGLGRDWQELNRAKPDDHYLRKAIEELGASDALYVGDSWVDVAAAQKTGIDVAFLRRDHRYDYGLETEPTYEIESLHDLHEVVG